MFEDHWVASSECSQACSPMRKKREESRMRRSFVILSLVFALVACSNDSDVRDSPTCTPGQTQICSGPAACKGGQVCTAQATWGVCDCGAAGHSGSSTGGTS